MEMLGNKPVNWLNTYELCHAKTGLKMFFVVVKVGIYFGLETDNLCAMLNPETTKVQHTYDITF